MPYLLILFAALCISITAARADEMPTSPNETINKVSHLSALVRTDRKARSWKTFKLMPGKVTYWYYEWILADGSKVTKVTNQKIKGVPDLRPLKESHPNLAIVVPTVTALGAAGGPSLARLWGER